MIRVLCIICSGVVVFLVLKGKDVDELTASNFLFFLLVCQTSIESEGKVIRHMAQVKMML